jgi:hypothetical protein
MRLAVTVAIGCSALLWPQTAEAQVQLEYKFSEGKTLTYKTVSRAHQFLAIMGTNIESTKRETKVWSRSVGKRRGDAALPVEEKTRSLRVEYSLPGNIHLTLDSSAPNSKITDPRLTFLGEVFKLESELAYTVVLDDQHRVQMIEGVEVLWKKAEKLDDPLAREEIRNVVNVDKLKTKLGRSLRNLPYILARQGEPWERTETLEINGKTFTIRRKYEYLGTEKKQGKNFDKIRCKVIEATFDQDPGIASPLKVTKSDLKVESSEGTIFFDRDQGYVKSATDKIRLKGNMTFSGAGVDQSGTVELSFDIYTELQPAAL